MLLLREVQARLGPDAVRFGHTLAGTLDAGDVVPKAAQKLLDLGYEAGLVSKRVEVEFVR